MGTRDRPVQLLLHRLNAMYGWKDNFYFRKGRRSYDKYPAVSAFIDEADRKHDYESIAWHMGRVRFFIEKLEAGKKLDPIHVDNYCGYDRIYPEPIIVDGHHRFIASKVTKQKYIWALYSGRTDVRDYLEGKTRRPPKE